MFITNTTKKHVKEYSYLEALRALREGRNTNPAHEDAFKTYLSLIKRRKIRIGIESQLMIWFNYEGSNYGGAICACFFRGFHGQLRSTDYTNLREMGRSTQHARSVGLKKKRVLFGPFTLFVCIPRTWDRWLWVPPLSGRPRTVEQTKSCSVLWSRHCTKLGYYLRNSEIKRNA
jgi:hypothetical protein